MNDFKKAIGVLSKSAQSHVEEHVRRTNPHVGTPRDGGAHLAYQRYNWSKQTEKVSLTDPRLADNYAHSKRDVAKYAKWAQKSPLPAVVLGHGEKRFEILDGAHRIEAGQKAGLTHIDAYIGRPK